MLFSSNAKKNNFFVFTVTVLYLVNEMKRAVGGLDFKGQIYSAYYYTYEK
jgi:hypothetical protein